MDTNQAFEELLSGKQVKQLGWEADRYLNRQSDNILMNSNNYVAHVCKLDRELFYKLYSNITWEYCPDKHDESWAFDQLSKGFNIKQFNWPKDIYMYASGNTIYRIDRKFSVVMNKEAFCEAFKDTQWENYIGTIDVSKFSSLF